MEEKPNPFLKRKPRIFLVGDPEKLGFKEVRNSIGDLKDSVDSEGIAWWSAITTVSKIIFSSENIPYGLYLKWIGDTLYYCERPKMNVPFKEQGFYAEFVELERKLGPQFQGKLKFFSYSPPVTDYSIPPEGTTERILFSKVARMVAANIKVRNEQIDEIKKHLEAIKNLI